MIRLFHSVFMCCVILSYALPLQSTPTDPALVPLVGSTPYATPNTFLPGVNSFNSPYYNYKYNQAAVGPAIPILSFANEHNPDGSYSYSFATADGKQVQEASYLKDAYVDNDGEPKGTQVVQGSYSYVSPEGTPVQVTYVADENGFHPSGVHIPADGKALPPLPFLDGRNSTFSDSIYNRYNSYFNRFGAYNRYHNGQYHHDGRFQHDPRHQYDPKYRYDARYQYDPKYHYDARYQYDPRYRYDGRYQYDPRYPYDARRPYDARYNSYYNKYNPFHLASLNYGAKGELKKD